MSSLAIYLDIKQVPGVLREKARSMVEKRGGTAFLREVGSQVEHTSQRSMWDHGPSVHARSTVPYISVCPGH